MKFSSLKRGANIILDVIYPKQCVCCNEIIDTDEELCDNCIRNIERIDQLKRCIKCGLEKRECKCKSYVYHFEGCVAPFYNEGLAQRGIYNYKIHLKQQNAIFFASEIAKTVITEYRGIDFDAVTNVPTSSRSKAKKGFDHSLLLAKGTAEILGLPFINNLLVRKRMFISQHKKRVKQRFQVVRKIYSFKEKERMSVKDKTVLLVDDIKTTGATLDECARQLLFAGAKRVYCAAAVITPQKNNDKKPKKERKINVKKVLYKFGDNLG